MALSSLTGVKLQRPARDESTAPVGLLTTGIPRTKMGQDGQSSILTVKLYETTQKINPVMIKHRLGSFRYG